MKILHIITGLATGGAERTLQKLLASLSRERYQSVVASLLPPGPVADEIERLGITVNSMEMDRGRPSLTGLLRLRSLASRVEPDLVHGWMYHGSLAATMSGQRVPLVWGIRHSIHDLSFETFRTRLVIRLLSALSARPSAIIYCARSGARQHEEIGFQPQKTRVIPNGFDCDTFCPDEERGEEFRRHLGIPTDVPLIGHAARFHPMKDHATLLKAASRLLRSRRSARFVLAGQGITRRNESIMEMVERYDLSDAIHLLGKQSDMPAFMNACDIFTVSSRWGEAFPNVLGEAMACGTLCVTTNVGDAGRILGDVGQVVPPGNPDHLCAAWTKMLGLEDFMRNRLVRAARERILDRFRLSDVAEMYGDLYSRLLATTEASE